MAVVIWASFEGCLAPTVFDVDVSTSLLDRSVLKIKLEPEYVFSILA